MRKAIPVASDTEPDFTATHPDAPASVSVDTPPTAAVARLPAAFDVESLFDDKLAPEPRAITGGRDLQPSAADAKESILAPEPPEAPDGYSVPRSRVTRVWPLIASAAVLGLVVIGFSARSCGSTRPASVATSGSSHVVVPAGTHAAPQAPSSPAGEVVAASPQLDPSQTNEPTAKPELAANQELGAANSPAPSNPPAANPPAPSNAEPANPSVAAATPPAATRSNSKAGPSAPPASATLTAAQAAPVPSDRGGVIAYKASLAPEIDYKAKARELFSAGKYREAAEEYQRASLKGPSDAGAFAGLGAAWLAAGQPDRAIVAYQRALQLKPQVSGFQAALGRAYLQKGDRGRAGAAYRKALELDPQNSAARTGLQGLGP